MLVIFKTDFMRRIPTLRTLTCICRSINVLDSSSSSFSKKEGCHFKVVVQIGEQASNFLPKAFAKVRISPPNIEKNLTRILYQLH